MNTNYIDHQDKVAKTITHLRELGFNTKEAEIIYDWFGSGSDEDQLDWLLTAGKQEITEAAQPVMEELETQVNRSTAAAILGRARTPRKAAQSRINGRKGGKPKRK